jgi:hypothetical protein
VWRIAARTSRFFALLHVPANCQARGTTPFHPSFAPELKRNSERLEGRANTLAVRLDRICKIKAPAEVRHAAVVHQVHQGEAECDFVL